MKAGEAETAFRRRRFTAIIVVVLLTGAAVVPGAASTSTEAGADGRVYFAGESACEEPLAAYEVYEGGHDEILRQREWYTIREDRHPDVETATSIAKANDIFVTTYVDWANHEVAILVDKVEEGLLQDGVNSLVQQIEENTSEVSFRIEVVCRSQQELDEIYEYVSSPQFQEQFDSRYVTAERNYSEGIVRIFADTNDEQLVRHLEERFGDAIVFDNTMIANAAGSSRLNDVQPHYGGARLTRFGRCTSNFAADHPNGSRYMLTAGHCSAPAPVAIWNG